MDKINRILKICMRIEELEHQLAYRDMMRNDADDARHELADLKEELEDLQPAT